MVAPNRLSQPRCGSPEVFAYFADKVRPRIHGSPVQRWDGHAPLTALGARSQLITAKLHRKVGL